MRWEQTVGLVQRCRIGPKISEFYVRWCQFGLVVSDWYVGRSVESSGRAIDKCLGWWPKRFRDGLEDGR
jgi:hypothetical protein